MRVSVEQGDPGYCLNHAQIRIFFQGTQVNNAITADEEQRMLKRSVLDEKGRLVPPKDGKLVTETVYGDVRIETPAGWFAWK